MAVLKERRSLVVVDLGDVMLDGIAREAFVLAHDRWRQAGLAVGYAASRPAGRGVCVVVMHRAGDLDGPVKARAALCFQALRGGDRRIDGPLSRLGAMGVEARVRPPSVATSALVEGMATMQSLQYGYRVPFIEHMLRTFGVVGSIRELGPAIQGATDRLTALLGDYEAQLVMSCAATFNGCSFCGPGHLYTANLLYFEATEQLHPLDEEDARGWLGLLDGQVLDTYRRALADPDHAHALALIERTFALRDGEQAEGALDDAIVGAIDAWALINECSLQTSTTQIQAMIPRIARARRLQRAYHATRRAVQRRAA